jgi:type I restriction enzyme S subunit
MESDALSRKVSDLIDAGVMEIGDGYRAKNSELSNEGLPFARAANINDGFKFDGADRFPVDRASLVGKKLSHCGDVVFTSKGTVGRFAFVTADVPQFVYSPQLCYWRSLEPQRLNPRYLYFWMQSQEFLHQIGYLKNQTDMADYVSLRDQRKMTLTIPNPDTQRSVADFLGAIESRIDLLRQTNTTLEAIAQALFKSWFVDFDLVHAKAEGREPEAMDAATAALFPSEFEESELGLIPKGWRTTTLRDAFEINPRRPLRKGVTVPYLDMASVPTSGHVPTPPTDREFSSGTKFQNGDTLLARITPCLENGKTAHVDFLDDGQIGWGSTEFIVLRPKTPLTPYFGYLLTRQSEFRAFAIQAMTGTSGRQRVELGQLEQFLLTIPDEAVAAAFGSFVEPIRKTISANADRAATLAALRNALLPRLVSGKLRLPGAAPTKCEAIEA